MQPTMTPTMAPDNEYQDIPGNPSTAKSSIQRLNDRSNVNVTEPRFNEDGSIQPVTAYK